MNKNDQLEKVISFLEEKCIINVEDHFDEYLLNDLSDIGEVTELFTDQDSYLYYWECAKELYPLLNIYLSDQKSDRSVLLRLIKLKRIIDGKLLEFGNHDIQEIERDLGLRFTMTNNQPIIIQDENVKASFFHNLYGKLYEKKFINNTEEEFLSNFNQSEEYTPINWIEKQVTLATLLKSLDGNQIISFGNKDVADVIRHFRKRGKLINVDSIAKQNYRIENNDFLYQSLDSIIKTCNK